MLKRITLLIMLLCAFRASFAANYLTFTAESDSSTFSIESEMGSIPDIQYSLDNGETWRKLDTEHVVTLGKSGDKCLLKGNNTYGFNTGFYDRVRFTMTGRIAASGSVMSLLDGVGESVVIPNDYCFFELFAGCASLTQAPELPALTLGGGECYRSMFEGCTQLTEAPALPAEKLSAGCYHSMFKGCVNLTQAPKLPATQLSYNCYVSMFADCESLVTAPELPIRQDAGGRTKLYYSYANEDFTTLETEPQLLFEYPDEKIQVLDADICPMPDGRYFMTYVAQENPGGIKYMISDKINHFSDYHDEQIDAEDRGCEAPNVWKRIGEDKWVVMYDIYSVNPHNFGFVETSDFKTFKPLGRFNEGVMKATNFVSPKHGSVIQITKAEAKRLEQYWNGRQKNTSIKSGDLWRDDSGRHINAHGGGILKYGDTYYWFGEHKSDRTSDALVGVMCYASKDLVNWRNCGVALSVSEQRGHDIERGCILERPKVIYNKTTKKFCMWFHLELKGRGYNAARYGVAVSDRPEGPYKFLYSQRANAGTYPMEFGQKEISVIDTLDIDNYKKWWTPEWYKAVDKGLFVKRDFGTGQMSRDMTLFVDDDGKAYHIFSSEDNLTIHIAELTNDYLHHTGRYTRLAPAGHNEAPAIFKKDGTYWMITSGCTGWDPNEARMFSAPNIWGPWTKHPNPCVGPKQEITFGGQSTFVLPVGDQFIFMADIWRPRHPSDARYIWLPITFEDGKPVIKWRDEWDVNELGK